MGVRDAVERHYWRARGHARPLPESFSRCAFGLRGLEIGGPSAVFGTSGIWPIYPALQRCDGVQWSATTVWHDLDGDAEYATEKGTPGSLHITDGARLDGLTSGAWDAVLSSHVVEHLADPLGALAAWRRVLVPNGWVFMVVPHRAGTFDHRRPVTDLAHLVEDREASTPEDDLTHLPETLALHDRSRDADPASAEEWAEARRRNPDTRVLHHHVFDGDGVLSLATEAGLRVHRFAVRHPHDIYMLARFEDEGERPDNSAVRARDAAWRRRSPFREDQRAHG